MLVFKLVFIIITIFKLFLTSNKPNICYIFSWNKKYSIIIFSISNNLEVFESKKIKIYPILF